MLRVVKAMSWLRRAVLSGQRKCPDLSLGPALGKKLLLLGGNPLPKYEQWHPNGSSPVIDSKG